MTEDSIPPSQEGASTATVGESRAYLHSYNLPSSGVAIEGYCPVAYFAVNRPVRGKPEFASIYNGETYHLVSADAKKAWPAAGRCSMRSAAANSKGSPPPSMTGGS